jgi:hypothetical protein
VPEGPSLAGLREAVVEFSQYAQAERSWAALRTATAPLLDPSRAAHRRALLAWLNAWGCRIRYPRPGEPDVFDLGVARWWDRCHDAIPDADTSLAELTDEAITAVARCYAHLAATPVTVAERPRTLGPTAAAKLLHALRPRAVMPWDAAIAHQLHGGRDAVAFASHQQLGRDWARRLLAEAGTAETSLTSSFAQPARSLATMHDDYCYLRFTRDRRD